MRPEDYYGYKKEDIVMLTDDSTNPRMMPTRENMLQAMQWLVRGASPNDALFFHCKSQLHALSFFFSFIHSFLLLSLLVDSGHGGQTKDTDGDEADGFDEGRDLFYLID